MRKYLTAIVLAVVAVFAFTSIAQADDVQSITAKLTPKKLKKKKFKPAKIYIEILTKNNDAPGAVNPEQPPSATNTKVNFPKNMKFNTKAVPRCKASEAQLQNTTTQQAIDLCGKKSVVSVGSEIPTSKGHSTGTSAWVTIGLPGPTPEIEVPVQVTAMNGTKKNQLYLHSRADDLGVTTVLVGKLKSGKKAPKGYGSQLDVTIPPLALGAIARFTTTVKAKKYVQARCKTKKMKFQAITKYTDHPTTSDDYKTKCKQKK